MAAFPSSKLINIRFLNGARIQRSTICTPVFYLGFIPGTMRSGGDDDPAVVSRHLLVRMINIRLVSTGSGYTAAQVIWNNALGDTIKILEASAL